LQSHYRSTLDFSDEALQAANTGYDKLLNTVRNLREELHRAESEQRVNGAGCDLSVFTKHFFEAMDDDFNTPLAIGVLFDIVREINQLMNSGQKLSSDALKKIDLLLSDIGGKMLGIIPSQLRQATDDTHTLAGLMNIILRIRQKARSQADYGTSDEIRKGLKELAIELEDKKGETTWHKAH
jgi:cysteinyl-tRNA synthetase